MRAIIACAARLQRMRRLWMVGRQHGDYPETGFWEVAGGWLANRKLLAEREGNRTKHLGRIERGEKVPSFELIVALARELGASPSAFFHFENANVDPNFLNATTASPTRKT